MRTREQILKDMDLAFKQDRERFFRAVDAMYNNPKYEDNLVEIKEIAQTWRDIPNLPDYPNIKHPMELPEWFPEIQFCSMFDTDYVDSMLELESMFHK